MMSDIKNITKAAEKILNKVPLNSCVVTILCVSLVYYLKTKSEWGFYVFVGSLILLLTINFKTCGEIIKNKYFERKIKKYTTNKRMQRKILKKISKEELSIIQQLYEYYPNPLSYDIYLPPISLLLSKGMIYRSNAISMCGKTLVSNVYLQPWVKNALDNNQEFLTKNNLYHEIELY